MSVDSESEEALAKQVRKEILDKTVHRECFKACFANR